MHNYLDYKPSAPALLVEIVEHIKKHDRGRVLSHQKRGVSVDQAVEEYEQCLRRESEEFVERETSRYCRKNHVWLYLDHSSDSIQHNNNLIKLNAANSTSWAPSESHQETGSEEAALPEHITSRLNKAVYRGSLSNESIIETFNNTKVKDLDLLRLRSDCNYYSDANRFMQDFKALISWNMLFRTHSYKCIRYLSDIYDQFVLQFSRKSVARRFQESKHSDFQKLFKSEMDLKVMSQQWPSIPTEFREYEYIQKYIPVPEARAQVIQQKLSSTIKPKQCPSDCPCLSDSSQPYCEFSLIEGTWVSKCANRVSRIECEHLDEEQQKRCRNSQISKKQRKTCRMTSTQHEEQGGNFDIEECLIWGIDLYTRKNIFYCLPESGIDETNLTKFDNSDHKYKFIESVFLKAVNFIGAQGYDIKKTCQYIIKNEAGMFSAGDKEYAEVLLQSVENSPSSQAFRIHSKGKGARCLNPSGIPQSQFIIEYFGEIYELWRWFQRQDQAKKLMKQLKMGEQIPDFYNIYLQKHKQEEGGCDMLVVDPISKGNFSSRFSHSCNPNCGTITTVSNGQYYIGMYAIRRIEYGEELTFDYCSVTESTTQHRKAICLCGMKECRGKYLQMSNAKAQNFVLDSEMCFQTRTASLLRSLEPVTPKDLALCAQHNLRDNLLKGCPQWLKKWSALMLAFIVDEGPKYKEGVLQQLKKNRVQLSQSEIDPSREELFADVSKSDLYLARHQNLVTTIDKLKYYLTEIGDFTPPLNIISDEQLIQAFWLSKSPQKSLIQQLKTIFQRQGSYPRQLQVIARLGQRLQVTPQTKDKMYLIRLYLLFLSHSLKQHNSLQSQAMADILHFHAYTFTYFTPHQYKALASEPIVVSPKELLNFSNKTQDTKKKDKTASKKYSSQFVWGQLVAWYKQTIAQPQASLSQDRRGTLTYPTADTLMASTAYPFEGNNRTNFLRAIYERPSSSWPPEDCNWSYKNIRKTYGTILFENYYHVEEFKNLQPPPNITPGTDNRRLFLHYVIKVLDQPLQTKVNLFSQVQGILQGREAKEITAQFQQTERVLQLSRTVSILKRPNQSTEDKKPNKRVRKSTPN